MKFKHGDKVKIIQRKPTNRTGLENFNKPNGDVGTICYIYNNTLRENLNGSGKYYGVYYNIGIDCFTDDDLELVTEESKFEVGKWYKYLDCYIKFKHLNNNIFVASDDILRGSYDGKGGNYGNVIDDEDHYKLLEDLTEIQQYLPEGHPDKIKSTIDQFKEGDYIVTLDVTITTHCAKNNYCFKQKHNSTYIMPSVDLKGSGSNSNTELTFNKNKGLKDWRYATSDEIAEYNVLGKPYDVTTLNVKKDDEGRLLKTFEVGEWYTNPSYPPINGVKYKYFRIFKIDVIKSSDYYYNSITFDQVADENWNIVNTWQGQSNTDFDQVMELVKKPLTELPEFWCVKVTEDNADVLSEWSGKLSIKLEPINGYLDFNKTWYRDKGIATEISFEDFQKLVLYKSYNNQKVSTKSNGEWVPKVGEWIVCTIGDTVHKKGDLTKVTFYGKHDGILKLMTPELDKRYPDKNGWTYKASFRKAEPYEIPNPCAEIPLSSSDKNPTENGTMKSYTAEEALAELKRRGFKKGCKYVYMQDDGKYDEYDIRIATRDPQIKGSYIDCGYGYLWDKLYPYNLHRGPILESETLPVFQHEPLTFKEVLVPNNTSETNYLKPETLLPKTKLIN